MLTPLGGEARPLEEWLTTFHLASVVLDPYTNESSWILKTAARILEGCAAPTCGSTSSSPADGRRRPAFLGPLADEFLVFCDPDRAFVKALGLATAAGVRLHPRRRHACRPPPRAGRPTAWRAVADAIADDDGVVGADIPVAGDPGPFHGTPALG